MPVSGSLPPYLSHKALHQCLHQALQEDLGTGDVTSEAIIPSNVSGTATFELRNPGVIAGLYAAEQVCAIVDPRLVVSWQYTEGSHLPGRQKIGTIRGSLRNILIAERLMLNIMQRMSGIATYTSVMVEAVKNFPARIRDTRKTAPGLRYLDKWAVLIGGGVNHRIGLHDRMLIKDNHITAAGSMHKALKRAFAYGADIPVDVEARTLEEVLIVLNYAPKVDLLLLDNMVSVTTREEIDTSMLQQAVELVKGRICTEASGNVTLHSACDIAATGVDYISCGALTHSVQALDISLKIPPPRESG